MGQRLGGAGVLAVAVATATILTTINVMLGPTAKAPVAAPATPIQPAAPAPAPPFAFTFSGYQVDTYRVLPPDEVSLLMGPGRLGLHNLRATDSGIPSFLYRSTHR